MKRFPICLAAAVLALAAGAAFAQDPSAPRDTVAVDSLATPAATPVPVAAPPPPAPVASTPPPTTTAAASSASSGSSFRDHIYYGGSVGFSFWSDYFRISLEPLVAYKLSPKLSVGGKFRYEYLNDSRGVVDYSSHNYGASVLSRYRLLPIAYAHAELAMMNYDYPSGRETVPFLLLGGGISKPIRPNVWANFEVLFDVLNDKNSPYEDWQPVVSVGVGVGF
jgi:hypothetical protein